MNVREFGRINVILQNDTLYSMNPHQNIQSLISSHSAIHINPTRSQLISEVIANKEALVTATGALATWNPANATGRSPKDTYIVKRTQSQATIDWTSPNNNAMAPELFDGLLVDALEQFARAKKLYSIDRVIGARSSYALPIKVVTDRAISTLFADTMFRPIPHDIASSMFANQPFTIVVAPTAIVDHEKYKVRLRQENGKTVPIAIIMDLDNRICLVMGTLYCGTVKKMMFTVMNHLLPANGILSLHASAVETDTHETVVFLGLSGTGKTTLSSDLQYSFIGDDELGWNKEGIANFEYGCYAKLVHLDASREPAIYHATFDPRPVEQNGCIIENAMMWPDGTFDLNDERLTENSRTSYPISFLEHTNPGAIGGHPKTLVLLTADANGVLPPVAKLTRQQAILWFLMGYTSKLAGTEVGVKEPSTTFSRFFGAPFMPRLPKDYTQLFDQYTQEHQTNVYLINTGWSGGPYGVGKRMDINLTRQLVHAAIDGKLEQVEFDLDPLFHILVPQSCPGIEDARVLHPRETWADTVAFDARASKLAQEFSQYFDKNFAGQGFGAEIVAQCPGK